MHGDRRELRYSFGYEMEYSLNNGSEFERFSGVAANISSSGLCLCSEHRLAQGQVIIIRSVLPVSFDRAVVRWSKSLGDGSYRAGLEFI